MADPNVVPMRLSRPSARRVIGEIAENSDRIVPTKHGKKRKRQRGISITQVRRVIKAGFVDGDPWMDEHGNWRVTMRGMSAGEEITVGLSIEWRSRLLIVTVFGQKGDR